MLLKNYSEIDWFIANKEKWEFEVLANNLKVKVIFFKKENSKTFNWTYQVLINRIKRMEGSYRTKEYLKKHLHNALERIWFKATDKSENRPVEIKKEKINLDKDTNISSILTKDRTWKKFNVKVIVKNHKEINKNFESSFGGNRASILDLLWTMRKALYWLQITINKTNNLNTEGLNLLWDDFQNENEKSTFEYEIINWIDLRKVGQNIYRAEIQDYILEIKIS